MDTAAFFAVFIPASLVLFLFFLRLIFAVPYLAGSDIIALLIGIDWLILAGEIKPAQFFSISNDTPHINAFFLAVSIVGLILLMMSVFFEKIMGEANDQIKILRGEALTGSNAISGTTVLRHATRYALAVIIIYLPAVTFLTLHWQMCSPGSWIWRVLSHQ